MTPQQYQSISDLYSLLARLWVSEVDQELLRAIQGSPIADALQITPDFAADSGAIDQLAVQYCELFIGPRNHLPPYQSVWQEGQLQSQTSDSVRSFAAAIGQNEFPSDTMPDHLGVQLRIMSRITAMLSNDGDNDSELPKVASEFFARHLTWPDRLLAAAQKKAQSGFYQAMTKLTGDLLESEREYWSQ